MSNISVIFGLALIATLCGCGGKTEKQKEDFKPSFPSIQYKKNYFKEAEKFHYQVKYGWLKGGQVTITVDTNSHIIESIPCYKVEIVGEATGMADRLNDFKDIFTSYIDTNQFLPVVFKRDLRENKYVKKDVTFFDRENLLATCKEKYVTHSDSIKKTSISPHIQDMISAYFLLRNIDLNGKSIKDTLVIDVFFDNAAYNLKLQLLRRETIKTRLGTKNCLVMSPIIPDNPFLRSESPILAWISDDEDRIPLRVKAKVLAGSFDVTITHYQKRGK